MFSLPIKYRLLTMIGVMALSIMAIVLFIIIPVIRQINELGQSIRITHEQVEEKQNQSQKLRRSLKELGEVKKNTDQFAETMIGPDSELNVITALEELATQYGIEQTLNVTLTEPEKQKKYYRFYFLEQGKFADQLNYLKALEKLPYYIIINRQQWERRKSASTSTPVNLRFDGIIYAKP